MRRHGGISDFRLVAGQGLTWVEHAGLATAVANFTAFPGAFCWHVKGLFGQGMLTHSGFLAQLALGVLQVTWFLSSLYLVSLYFTLFFGPRRHAHPSGDFVGAARNTHSREQARRLPTNEFVVPASSWLRAMLLLGQWVLVWYGNAYGLFFFDTLWLESGWSQYVSYY
jgi:hypothetical protein